MPDAEAVGRDRDEWVDSLVHKWLIAPPTLAGDGAPVVEDLGRVVRDVTHQGGITVSMSEWGNVKRDTVNYRVAVRFDGDVSLLLTAPSRGTAYVPAESVGAGQVVQSFYYVIGNEPPQRFDQELQQWLSQVQAGAGVVAAEVEQFNARLPAAIGKLIDDHVSQARAAVAFTAALPFAVTRRPDAPPELVAPSISAIQREMPSTRGTRPPAQPTLGKYFDEILAVIESAVRAIERTPGRYHEWGEEELRDSLLVMLNSQFEASAQGEAFNSSGKTDLLIRAGDENLFIGECKIWGGPKEFDSAIDQLLSYSTWRDSRLALIVFVRVKNIAETLRKAQEELESRPEFEHWLTGAQGRKAHIRWQDDQARTATLALLMCHIAR